MRTFKRTLLATAVTFALATSGAASAQFSNGYFFGDSLTDTGWFKPVLPAGTGLFTTNPGPIWATNFAQHFGFTATPANQGGTNYAQGGANVTATPGYPATPPTGRGRAGDGSDHAVPGQGPRRPERGLQRMGRRQRRQRRTRQGLHGTGVPGAGAGEPERGRERSRRSRSPASTPPAHGTSSSSMFPTSARPRTPSIRVRRPRSPRSCRRSTRRLPRDSTASASRSSGSTRSAC